MILNLRGNKGEGKREMDFLYFASLRTLWVKQSKALRFMFFGLLRRFTSRNDAEQRADFLSENPPFVYVSGMVIPPYLNMLL